MTRFQVLALDGGGIRGLYSAAVLAKLEDKCDIKITDHFDLITGTSTGGIIALGLGLGLRPREIVRFYMEEGPKIFHNPFYLRNLLQIGRHKYSAEPLQTALKSNNAFGDKLFGQSKCRLVIPAYKLSHDEVRVFKTPHHPDLTTDWKIPAWKIAMATSAAPTYFPASTQIEHSLLIDGGVWANNPAVVGIAEAVSVLGCSLKDIRVLSLGTTDSRKKRPATLKRGGFLQWVCCLHVISVLTRGQSVGINGLAKHLIGKENFHRLDAIVPRAFKLDSLNEQELFAEAEHTALHECPILRSRFFDHRAPIYVPLHSN